ncbi:hypothetical protein TWF281_008438 [Arthrobotrys megalospora]
MSQIILPPPTIQILAYKAITIDSQSSVSNGAPLVTGIFPYINDPLADQDVATGKKHSLKDIPPHIMTIASFEMDRIQSSEQDSRVKWFTGDMVYVNGPTFTFGMAKVIDPAVEILAAFPSGTVRGGYHDCLQSNYNSRNDEDVDMVSVEYGIDASDQDRDDLAAPAQVNGVKEELANGYAASLSTLTSCEKHYTDETFIQSELKREDGTGVGCSLNNETASEDGEGIPGLYGSYAT